MSLSARELIRSWIFAAAGTDDDVEAVAIAAVDLILEVAHVRRCWNCKRVALHRDGITPWVTCKVCGSNDTRKVKES